MFQVRRLLFSGLIILSLPVFSLEMSNDVYTLVWQRALGGSIDAFPAQGPGGDIYVIADDRALHSLNPVTGESRWIYRPGGRLRNWLMVAPDGTIYVQNDREELYAVTPGGTGRWKLRMNGEPSALPAAGSDGRVVLPLVGGRIICLSRHGYVLWNKDLTSDAASGPVISDEGNVWIPLTDGRTVVLNPEGELVGETPPGAAITALALDESRRIWAGSLYGGISVYAPDTGKILKPEFEYRFSVSRVVAILTSGVSGTDLFYSDGSVVSVAQDGSRTQSRRIGTAGAAPSAGADGTLYLPLANGTIKVLKPDGLESTLQGRASLAEPLITREGYLVAGGSDWILYAWQVGEPGIGWRQFRGGPGRTGAFTVERIPVSRQKAREDVGFFYREKMARSANLDERLELLDELESFPDERAMLRSLPWAGLLLEDLAGMGTVRRVETADSSLSSHVLSRARAYRLLGSGEDFRNRDYLLECLRSETDSLALSSGFRALGNIGSDWDGASLRMILSRYRSISPPGERLTVETSRAVIDLVRYNGKLTDPAGYALFDLMLRASITESARQEIIASMRLISGL